MFVSNCGCIMCHLKHHWLSVDSVALLVTRQSLYNVFMPEDRTVATRFCSSRFCIGFLWPEGRTGDLALSLAPCGQSYARLRNIRAIPFDQHDLSFAELPHKFCHFNAFLPRHNAWLQLTKVSRHGNLSSPTTTPTLFHCLSIVNLGKTTQN
ncbi:unnamed protein product [Nesidiocoris tenuis]|uniref:Uncharacterized protein n=1 Tax=Nesidiocoris tenuis TaxID=355587 RepID=A0A6H5GTN4_9HEMI|nr:unnamed protein product [Nesidiocoris tenuis]CAB0006129.1 unnamed protein product [Nesidiocoris tenuis]